MADPQIEKLLIVQDRDVTLQKIEQELSRIPSERVRLETQAKAEEQNIEASRQALKEKEAQCHQIDTEALGKKADIVRFKNQQLEVRKNDEYQALTQQIEREESNIAELEERELELMLEIDATRETFEVEKTTIEQRIRDWQAQIKQLDEREQRLKDSIKAAKQALADSREDIQPNYIEHYDRVRKLTKRAPYVVSLQTQTCGGCHLRVSNEVSRGAMRAGEPHFCDQCARMVYA